MNHRRSASITGWESGSARRSATCRVWLMAVVTSMMLSCGGASGSNPPQNVSKVQADLKAAKVTVGFKDQGQTFTLSRNDLFGVSLDGRWYNVASSNPLVISMASGPAVTADDVTIATFRALTTGHAQVTANTKSCPTCGSAEAVFRVDVVVASS